MNIYFLFYLQRMLSFSFFSFLILFLNYGRHLFSYTVSESWASGSSLAGLFWLSVSHELEVQLLAGAVVL